MSGSNLDLSSSPNSGTEFSNPSSSNLTPNNNFNNQPNITPDPNTGSYYLHGFDFNCETDSFSQDSTEQEMNNSNNQISTEESNSADNLDNLSNENKTSSCFSSCADEYTFIAEVKDTDYDADIEDNIDKLS